VDWYKTARYGGSEKERSIWYHGTRGKNLPSVMSQGLIPDPKKREWAEDPSVGLGNMPRTSLGGVYVTQNLMTAISSANRSRDRKGGEPAVIVIIELQPRTLVVDEDHISVAQHALPFNYVSDHWIAETFMLREIGGLGYADHLGKLRKDYAERVLAHVKRDFSGIHPAMEKVAVGLLNEMWDAVLDRQAAYAYVPDASHDWRAAFWRTAPQALQDRINREMEGLGWSRQNDDAANDAIYREAVSRHVPKHPDAGEANAKFMGYMDKLTRLFKGMARPAKAKEQALNPTGRVLEPIGFSGSNRIVGIVEVVESSTELYLEDVKVVWGNLPDKFVSDWTKAVGELRIVSRDKPAVSGGN